MERGAKHGNHREGPDLQRVLLQSFKDSLEGGSTETAADSGRFILLIPGAKSLGSKVEGISKRLMDAFQRIMAGHENLVFY
jgi:hypothetical protein